MAFNLHLQQRSQQLGRKGLGDPEMVISHDWLTAVAGHHLSKRWQIPHLWTVHDTVYGKRFGKITGTEDRVARDIELWAARSADRILANSVEIVQEIQTVYGAPKDRVELLHPGIDPNWCEEVGTESRRRALRSMMAEPHELLMTFAGRLDLEKGIDTLLSAFAILKQRVPDARLAIVGKGVLQPVIEDHARKLRIEDSVILPGYLEGQVLRSLYRVSDIHVCPSHYEPFGLVALEAMAAGTPVIVSDTGGLRDLVPDSTVGRKVPPRNPQALADALEELAGDSGLRRRLGTAGQEYARRTFAWPVLAARAAELYSTAARRTPLVAV
jgi:glycosyltransferase involved in cell wall biosynthesis